MNESKSKPNKIWFQARRNRNEMKCLTDLFRRFKIRSIREEPKTKATTTTTKWDWLESICMFVTATKIRISNLYTKSCFDLHLTNISIFHLSNLIEIEAKMELRTRSHKLCEIALRFYDMR